MKKFITASLAALAITGIASAQDRGAFNVLNMAVEDQTTYVAALKANPVIFSALEAEVAGVCRTTAGSQYYGEMFVWTGYSSMGDAMDAGIKFLGAPTSGPISEMRTIIDSEMYVPINDFELNPGVERVYKVKTSQPAAYAEAISAMEAAMHANGFEDIFMAVLTAPVSGPDEVGIVTVRVIAPDSHRLGALMAAQYAAPDWYAEALTGIAATGREIVNDSVEVCEIIYTAE